MNAEQTNTESTSKAGPILFTVVTVAWVLFFVWLVAGSLPGMTSIGVTLALAGFFWWFLNR